MVMPPIVPAMSPAGVFSSPLQFSLDVFRVVDALTVASAAGTLTTLCLVFSGQAENREVPPDKRLVFRPTDSPHFTLAITPRSPGEHEGGLTIEVKTPSGWDRLPGPLKRFVERPPISAGETLREQMREWVRGVSRFISPGRSLSDAELEGDLEGLEQLSRQGDAIAEEIRTSLLVEEAVAWLIPFLSRTQDDDPLAQAAVVMLERIGKRVLPFLEGAWPVSGGREGRSGRNPLRKRLLEVFSRFGRCAIPHMEALVRKDGAWRKALLQEIASARQSRG